MKKSIFYLLIFLLFSCNSSQKEAIKEDASVSESEVTVELTETQMKNAEVKLGKLENRVISATLKLNGKVDVPPQNLVSISIPMGGYLKETDLLPGSQVKKGQVLAYFEDQQYVQLQQEYLLAKVKVKLMEQEYTRQKELNVSKASSDKVLNQAEADYKNARILMSALVENLKLVGINPSKLNENSISKRISIVSPITGYVAKVNANIGKYLTPSDVLFELVNVADIHLNINVYEKDLSKLFIGQRLVAFTNNDVTKSYPCEIILIGHTLGTNKNTEVHCHFDKYDKSLVPGMYMNAVVQLKDTKVWTIQESAVVRFGNFEYIFVEKTRNTFEMVEVNSGEKQNGFVEIKNPENFLGKKIVMNGAYSLLMKLKNAEEEE